MPTNDFELTVPDLYVFSDPSPLRSDPVVLPTGVYDYPFKYKLPDKLPSSFESQHSCKGRVHYQLRARLDSPDDSIKLDCYKVFVVLATLDLNTEPRASVSVINLIIVVNIIEIYLYEIPSLSLT